MRTVDTTALRPARVSNVHGAAGTTSWLQVVAGHALRGPWEAVELAAVPPEGVSGLHRHTRTSEIYYGLQGAGELATDGVTHAFARGSLALTSLGSVHGLRNAGAADLRWLVVEVPARRSGVSPGRRDSKEARMDLSAQPVELPAGSTFDLLAAEADPLHSVGLMSLAAGERRHCSATDGTELFAFVVEGELSVVGDQDAPALAAGVAVTLPRGEEMTLQARTAAQVFWVKALVDWQR